MQTKLEQAVAFIKAGDTEKGKQLLSEVIKQNPMDENAWLWMTRCVTTTEQKKYCFDRVLQINPQNPHAIKGLERLNSPVLSLTELKVRPVQPAPTPQSKPKNSNVLILSLSAISITVIICVCLIGLSWLRSPSSTSQIANTVPTQRTRPDYKSMLEDNGFVYSMSDNQGNPSYVSPCGAMATVRSNGMGFIADYGSGNTCAMEDLGAIISLMYPSEVFDSVVTSVNLLDGFDQMITRTAVGYKVSVVLTSYDNSVIIVIIDPSQ